MQNQYISTLATALNIAVWQVENTLELFEQGATVPFIARYRKERTGMLDEVVITDIRDRHHKLVELDKRRQVILESIREQDLLTADLEQNIMRADTLTVLEDIYLPYKPKRRTRAVIAREKGLEPLAKMVMSQQGGDVEDKAMRFIDNSREVHDAEEALAGARDIIAEWVSEHQYAREKMRRLFLREAMIISRMVKDKEEAGVKYRDYFEWDERLKNTPSHRVLAMLRGEKEGVLRISVKPDEEDAVAILEGIFVKGNNSAAHQVKQAVKDSYKRLLQPALETEMRQWVKEKSDEEAIRIFAENLRQLLLASPLGEKNTLAIDPGFRTGCKVVCLDRQGNLKHNETIYPHPPQKQRTEAIKKIRSLVDAYKIEAIAIGNGTAGRETEELIRHIPFKNEIIAIMVNESGASVYSASAVARQEFPEYDVTVRGAVSIGRRLMDPLAELVKIDAKSIGVGQYQHDVDQKALQNGLDDVVVSCVNRVGVEVNTASKQLLAHVSGVGPALAQNIVEYRKQNGPFANRKALLKVPRFGAKGFEQAAGFLRIRNAKNPLDSSSVHPESYGVVANMAKDAGVTVADLISDEQCRKNIDLNRYVTDTVGLPTLQDIMQELEKPGRDPRSKFEMFEFDRNVNHIDDLIPGMELPGIVTNITAFGAFVDVGVHQDGLVHKSQMADRYVSDPSEVVKLHQQVKVKVLEVDVARKRIQLSMKGV